MELTDKAAEILGDAKETSTLKRGTGATQKPEEKSFENLRRSLQGKMKRGAKFYTIKNPLDSVFHTDWSLSLLPKDVGEEAQKYFEQKYVQLGGEKFIPGVSFIIVKRPDNTAVNLLDNFLVEKGIPTQIPLNVGGEAVVKSQFVINPDETLVINEDQKEDLMRFVKWRRQWQQDDGTIKKSDWLGFLVLREVTESTVGKVKFDRAVLSREDLSSAPADAKAETKSRTEVRHGDAIFGDEED